MADRKRFILDGLYTVFVLAGSFTLARFVMDVLHLQLAAMLLVLEVFLVAYRTQGYFWGITASLVSVVAVDFAFTHPFYAFTILTPEVLSSAAMMLVVSIMTSTMTTRLKQQEKVKAEAETERMRGNLLRAVSHDLRTPLTSIYGSCSTMLEAFDTLPREKHLKMLQDVCNDAQWLVRMVENLLSVTRIDPGGRLQLNLQDTVVEELVDAVLAKFRKHHPGCPVLVCLPEEMISVPMDAILIEQVLMNLLENAFFHARGMEHLWLNVSAQGPEVAFLVEDDGCGIPAQRLDKLFTACIGTPHAADTSRSSMGIGLTVCSAIIRAHGGQIQGGNRPGGGAYFRFTLNRQEDSYAD